jgi:hypothetical protein
MKDAAALAAMLAALPALAMRRAVLAERLERLALPERVTLLGAIIRRAPSGAPYDTALLALGALLDDEAALGYEARAALYAGAVAAGDVPLARLFLSPEPPPAGEPARVPVLKDRPDLTLGERKSLARGPVPRHRLDRLLWDLDPQVLRILLGNPRLTEEDAVRIAARRPNSPAALREVFRSERFVLRYAVRRALAFNPYTPSDLAARLVPLLQRNDLLSVAEDHSLGEAARGMARDLLASMP